MKKKNKNENEKENENKNIFIKIYETNCNLHIDMGIDRCDGGVQQWGIKEGGISYCDCWELEEFGQYY